MTVMEITDTLAIPDDELLFSYARSGGPGGQNVNKVASKAVLRWTLAANTSLPADVRERLRQQQANRITAEGELVIQGQRFRDQARNAQDCLDRLRALVLQALTRPTPRKKTKPTRGSKRRRLDDKRQRSARKERRRGPGGEE
jgi:ribosome-associated protein